MEEPALRIIGQILDDASARVQPRSRKRKSAEAEPLLAMYKEDTCCQRPGVS